MKKLLAIPVLLFMVVCCAGCGSQMPLIFGQGTTVGIDVAVQPETQQGNITLGYKDVNIAIVPVATDNGTTINSRVFDGSKDALSVFGQFGAKTNAAGVGLGKFFATGAAASSLADGFEKRLFWTTDKYLPGNVHTYKWMNPNSWGDVLLMG